MSRILVAGAQGFLGSYICEEAMRQGHQVIALSGQSSAHAQNPQVSQMTHLCLRLENFAELEQRQVFDVCEDVDVVINASGPGDPSLPQPLLSQLHVYRTTPLLALALRLPALKQFVQVSSVAIAGDHVGLFSEAMRDVGQRFKGGIGRAYLAAEHCVAGTDAPFARTIARLGVLVGDSQTGYYPRLSGVYKVLSAATRLGRYRFPLERLGMIVLPFSEQGRCHLVPVDLAAQAILRIATQASQDTSLRTYHVLGGTRGISVRRLLDVCLQDAGLDLELLPSGDNALSRNLFTRLGFHPSLVEALSTRAFWTHDSFSTLMPDFSIPALADLGPVLLRYAHANLLGGERP